MLTIFTVPKPFLGATKVIQENAITSWKRLDPHIDIILCGDEDGIAEAAEQYQCTHNKGIEKNEYGTPFLNSIFQSVQALAQYDIICYVNTDIILFKDIIMAIRSIEKYPEFLLIGRRMNVDFHERVTVEDSSWEEQMQRIIHDTGQLGNSDAIDYFIFPKSIEIHMPDFCVGRAGWDNWLISYMKKRKVPVFDGSALITALHQNHDYYHVPSQRGNSWEGPETDKNRELMGGFKNLYTIDDADYLLTKNEIVKKRKSVRDYYRMIVRYLK